MRAVELVTPAQLYARGERGFVGPRALCIVKTLLISAVVILTRNNRSV